MIFSVALISVFSYTIRFEQIFSTVYISLRTFIIACKYLVFYQNWFHGKSDFFKICFCVNTVYWFCTVGRFNNFPIIEILSTLNKSFRLYERLLELSLSFANRILPRLISHKLSLKGKLLKFYTVLKLVNGTYVETNYEKLRFSVKSIGAIFHLLLQILRILSILEAALEFIFRYHYKSAVFELQIVFT